MSNCVYFLLNLKGMITPEISVNDCEHHTLLSCCVGSEELWSEADSSCSGQPIHLWQFLRELLLKPHSYGRCIRWLNKEKGTKFCSLGIQLHNVWRNLEIWNTMKWYLLYKTLLIYKQQFSCDSHQAFLKLKTPLTLQGCGDSGRIAQLWTTTSWAAPYASTTRRVSFASLMCPRDWCTSLFTQYEVKAEWEEEEKTLKL